MRLNFENRNTNRIETFRNVNKNQRRRKYEMFFLIEKINRKKHPESPIIETSGDFQTRRKLRELEEEDEILRSRSNPSLLRVFTKLPLPDLIITRSWEP